MLTQHRVNRLGQLDHHIAQQICPKCQIRQSVNDALQPRTWPVSGEHVPHADVEAGAGARDGEQRPVIQGHIGVRVPLVKQERACRLEGNQQGKTAEPPPEAPLGIGHILLYIVAQQHHTNIRAEQGGRKIPVRPELREKDSDQGQYPQNSQGQKKNILQLPLAERRRHSPQNRQQAQQPKVQIQIPERVRRRALQQFWEKLPDVEGFPFLLRVEKAVAHGPRSRYGQYPGNPHHQTLRRLLPVQHQRPHNEQENWNSCLADEKIQNGA